MKFVTALFLLLALTGSAIAQDSDFVRARKYLDQIENGTQRLQRNDVEEYNRLVEKLSEAGTLLGQTASKDHAEYKGLTERWNAAKDRLIAIPSEWQEAAATQQAAPRQEAPQQRDPRQHAAQQAPPQGNSKQIYETIMAKYQKRNRPQMPANPTVEDIGVWVQQMQYLAGPQMDEDTRLMEEYFAAGKVNKGDKGRYDRWVRQSFHQDILGQITQTGQIVEQGINRALERARFIATVDEKDQTAVMNTAGSNGDANFAALEEGLVMMQLTAIFDEAAGQPQPQKRAQQKQEIQAAKDKLIHLAQLQRGYAEEWAKLPKKSRKNPRSQYLWLDGSRFCEITEKGEVWKNGNYMGSIEADGEVWVKGSSVGSFEPDGKVWMRGSSIGTLTGEREIWVRGSKVGLIEPDGTVWIGGSSRGTVEGPGDWRRAAIVYYYDFY